MNMLKQPFRYRNDGAVFWIIGVNLLVFLAMYFFGRSFRGLMTTYLAMIPRMVLRGWVWTFVTYMFVHGGFSHVFFNMFALFIFGAPVERQMGSREFLLFYFVTGTLAGVFSFFVYMFTGAYWVALVGASGAIFAVELAYAVYFPTSIIYIWGIIPLRAPVMVLGFTALELILSFTGRNSGVAHFTHLAGFAFAWIYFLVRFGVNPWRRLVGRE